MLSSVSLKPKDVNLYNICFSVMIVETLSQICLLSALKPREESQQP